MKEAAQVRATLEAMRTSEGARSRGLDENDPWERSLARLCHGPEPTEAITRATGLPDSVLGAGPLPEALVELLHQGRYPARLLTLVPEALAVLDGPVPTAPSLGALADEIERGTDGSIEDTIGRVRTREYLRLARLECSGAPLEEVGGGLSTLAAACCEAALRATGLHEEVCIIGMGKLGGHELNFMSDIDLVFVHDDDVEVGTDSRRRLVAVRDRLRQVVRLLEGSGRWRPVFRVDLRLRPFGSQGPLSLSLSNTEAYYEKHGRPWERQAWIRGAPIAGNLELGLQLQRRLTPFVYRRSVSSSIFEEIADLMARARRGAGRDEEAVDLKLDPGGIREIEFTAQALQLLHGGRRSALRTRGTLETLDRLLAAGLLSDREHADLTAAYRELRHIEHRLQLVEGAQTHTIAAQEDERQRLAARMRYEDVSGAPSAEVLLERVTAHRHRVEAIAATVGGHRKPPPTARARAIGVVCDLGASRASRLDGLRTLGLADPEEAEAQLAHLASRPDSALLDRGPGSQGALQLLEACLDASDPDLAVTRFVEFASRRPAHFGVWRFLAAAPSTELVHLAAELFGSNEPLSRGLVGFPSRRGEPGDESIELLLSAGATSLPGPAEHAMELGRRTFAAHAELVAARRFKHHQLVRIALFDLGHRPEPDDVSRSLTSLADLMVRIAVRELAAEMAAHRPRSHGLTVAVFGLGKLGMEAMDYGSDLDLMLVYEQDELDGATEATRFGQRLIAKLQDRSDGMRLYEVDMRLRPSGKQGLLVSSRTAFSRYHAQPLPAWERLALLRARAVAEVTIEPGLAAPSPQTSPAGTHMATALPGELSAEVARVIRHSIVASAGQALSELAVAVRDLKLRIEREIARETRRGSAPYLHIKAGVGGVLEAELLVGALQLRVADRPDTLHRSIAAALDGLVAAGAMGDNDALALRAAYDFQRRLLNRLRTTQPAGMEDPDRIAENSPRLATLARRMGLPDKDELLHRLADARRTVRDSFDQYLAPSGNPHPTQS